MEGDHIIPWKDGGLAVEDNLMMLCKKDNRMKSGK
ncbi:MAG TPA: HNH endonuclease signature motif containing protein [Kaistella sp.]|nr:HNH endonuclease signature motif containing protein [Kaistella sp.]HQD45357.1 HNH endonuclease signature motif containing protein [Kaistella sp.]